MTKKSLRAELIPLVGTKTKVRLTRLTPHKAQDYGFVAGIGREWMLLQNIPEFCPDGYIALRVNDLTEIRSGPYERFWEHMFQQEGLLENLSPTPSLPLNDTETLLRALQTRGENVILECEKEDPEEDGFHIGKILVVEADCVHFAFFDALGKWDKAAYTIPLSEITNMQIDTAYVRTFSKYLEGPCPL